MEGKGDFQKQNNSELKSQTQVLERPNASGANGLRIRFGSFLKKENEVRLPKIENHVFLNKHRSPEVTAVLKDQFKNCDIYFPENFAWRKDFLKVLRDLSDGNVTPEEALQEWGDSRDEQLFRMIHNSKKPIAFLDVSEDNKLVEREDNNKFPNIQFGFGFSHVTDSIKRYVKEFADIEVEREAYMSEQLKPQIQELLETHPELRAKRKISTLISIGEAHDSLYRSLRKSYKKTTVSGKSNMVLLYKEEAFRRQMSNEKSGDDLFARIAAEQTLLLTFPETFYTADPLSDALKLKNVIGRFSFDQLRESFENARSLSEWADMLQKGPKEGVRVPVTVR